MNSFTIAPGVRHPEYPNWQVEQVVHSRAHPALVKYQWVRRDGARSTLMGYHSPFHSLVHGPGSSPAGPDFDILVADKHRPLGADDPSLKTVRYESSNQDYNEHPEGVLMVWP